MKKIIKNLISEMAEMPVIDAHEHLPAEAEIITQKADVLTRLYCHYSITTAESAGFKGDRSELKNTSIPLEKRWRLFRPYLNAIKDSGYATPARIAARDLYGIEEINDNTYQELSDRVQTANKPGLYDDILKKRCNIKKILNQGSWDDGPGGYSVGVSRVYTLSDKNQATALLHQNEESNNAAFTDAVEWINHSHREIRESGALGIKFQANNLKDEPITDSEGERLFAKLREHHISDEEVPALCRWIAEKAVELAPKHELTVAVHCGLNWNCWNKFADANPVNLTPLLIRHKNTIFDLYHGGIPYVREAAVMANQFPNVNLNLVWCHQISPYMTENMLNEWIDLVPVNKIIGFGGDNCFGPEKTYGVLVMARENIARTLALRINRGEMSESRALEVCRMWLHDNPKRIYGT